MKILFLSPHIHLIDYLIKDGDEVTQTIEPLTEKLLKDQEFIISYGYRYKIDKPILDRFKDRVINLHISYLPWNRGADPNLWSFLDNTPKGVTIHFLDEGIDTGDIIAQRYVKFDIENDTLRTTYKKLSECIEDMFKKVWPYIRQGKAKRYKQVSFHTSKDKNAYKAIMHAGWDTPIKDVIGRGKK
ncbi:MAG: formyltransferase family protein [Candidatus Odinarchaeota archaeon]